MDFIGFGKRFKVSRSNNKGWWDIVEKCDTPFVILRQGDTAIEAFQSFLTDYEKELISLRALIEV